MTEIEEITEELIKFRDERDWAQFHNPKDLAIAISIEANELLENFLWINAEEASIEKIQKEIADVLSFSFLLADKYKLDIKHIILEKIKENALKYPVQKAKGSSKKYDQLN